MAAGRQHLCLRFAGRQAAPVTLVKMIFPQLFNWVRYILRRLLLVRAVLSVDLGIEVARLCSLELFLAAQTMLASGSVKIF